MRELKKTTQGYANKPESWDPNLGHVAPELYLLLVTKLYADTPSKLGIIVPIFPGEETEVERKENVVITGVVYKYSSSPFLLAHEKVGLLYILSG